MQDNSQQPSQTFSAQRNVALRDRVTLFFKGMAMGAADLVPGVSGGTIALITNIYEELIFSLRSINPALLGTLWRQGFAAAWKQVNGTFLLVLLLGIVTSLKLLANTILFLLEHYQEHLLSFFIGLILASSWYVASSTRRRDGLALLLALAGCAVTVGLAFLPQSTAEPSLPYIFLCGAIAICAMILPGISGAFILILLGAYEQVLHALRNLEFLTIGVFAAGCACGLIAFSNLLSWLFRHYRDRTLSFLLGILLGSLYSIWPWKEVSVYRTDAGGESVPVTYQNIWPGFEANLLVAVLLVIAGFVLVYGLEKIVAKEPAAAE